MIKIPVLALNSLDLKLVSSLTGCVTLSGLMNLSESLFATLLKEGSGGNQSDLPLWVKWDIAALPRHFWSVSFFPENTRWHPADTLQGINMGNGSMFLFYNVCCKFFLWLCLRKGNRQWSPGAATPSAQSRAKTIWCWWIWGLGDMLIH